jgi:hypothetical protein
MAITADDELRHQPTDEESWRESMWFCWQMPEHGIGSSMSFNYRPNTSQPGSNLRIAVCRGLESENNKPLYSRHDQPPLPEGDFDDFAFPPRFRMQRIGPLEGFRMQFDDQERLSFDYEIRFFAGAFHWADGVYPTPVYLGNRYHCPFTIEGTLRLDGETFAVRHQGDHDHSWGTRPLDWHVLEGTKYVAGQFGTSLAFSIATTSGPDGVVPHGFVWDGSRLAAVSDVELANEYDEDGVQRRTWLNLVDVSGRLTQVTAEAFANYPTEQASVTGIPAVGTDYHNNDVYARMRVAGSDLEGSGIVSYYWGREYYHRVLMGEA